MSLDASELELAHEEQRKRNEAIGRGDPRYVKPVVEAQLRGLHRCKVAGCSFQESWNGPMREEVRREIFEHEERHRIDALPLALWTCSAPECSEALKFRGKLSDSHNARLLDRIAYHKLLHEVEAESALA